jgi:uncharacterized protein (DUF1697 family)
MPVMIAMLRGVNVGAANRMKMEDLRGICTSLKFRNPQTYVQSGNVIFTTEEKDLSKVAKKLEDALEKKFGFRPAVVLRTTDELRKVVKQNPFAQCSGIEPGKLLVTFHVDDPGKEVRANVLAIKSDLEELHFIGRELYIYFPNGMGKTKLPLAAIQKLVKTPGTARNWNSVTKMLKMAEEMEAYALTSFV